MEQEGVELEVAGDESWDIFFATDLKNSKVSLFKLGKILVF